MTLNNFSVSSTTSLQQATNTGNVTTNTVEFTNPTTAFVTTGNVGIGVTAPESKLTIKGVNGRIDQTSLTQLRNSSTITLQAYNATADVVCMGLLTTDQINFSGDNPNFYIQNMWDNQVSGGRPILLNPADGNVGIGVTNPSQKLDVNGVIKNQNPSWNLYMSGSPSPVTSGVLQFNNSRVTATNCTLNTSGGLTSRVTITVAGRYFIGFNAFTDSSVTANAGVDHTVRINGNSYVRNYHTQPISNYSAMGGLGCLADLSVNDYVEIYSLHTVHYNSNSSFYGFMIS